MTAKEKLQELVDRYQYAKDKRQLQNASEATMRTWIAEGARDGQFKLNLLLQDEKRHAKFRKLVK